MVEASFGGMMSGGWRAVASYLPKTKIPTPPTATSRRCMRATTSFSAKIRANCAPRVHNLIVIRTDDAILVAVGTTSKIKNLVGSSRQFTVNKNC
jgi:hypothetical protein